MDKVKLTIATSIKDEGPYILEWVSYYKMLGVDEIFIYSNDNSDGSDNLLYFLDKFGHIKWIPQEIKEGESAQKISFAKLTQEMHSNLNSNKHYVAFFDVDEYLVMHTESQVKNLLKFYDYPDALYVNWKLFGSSNHLKYYEQPTICRFNMCIGNSNKNNLGKCIIKINPNLYREIQGHRPVPITRNSYGRVIYCTKDPKGEVVQKDIIYGSNPRRIKECKVHHEICQLNHYAVRSKEEYNWKKKRGNGFDLGGYNDNYFRNFDCNKDIDDYAKEKYGVNLIEKMSNYEGIILSFHNKIIKSKTKQ